MAAVESDIPPLRATTVDDLGSLAGLQSKQAPPRGAGAGPKTESPKPPPRPRATAADKLEAKLVEMFGFMGMAVSLFNPVDGFIIGKNAESLAMNWTALAEENASVKRVLNAMLEGGAWGGALMATAAVAIPIMDNHGLIPEHLRPFVPQDSPTAGSGPAAVD